MMTVAHDQCEAVSRELTESSEASERCSYTVQACESPVCTHRHTKYNNNNNNNVRIADRLRVELYLYYVVRVQYAKPPR